MPESPQTSPALPSELPVVPLRGAVVLPLTVAPLGVSRPVSVEAVNRALAGDRLVLLLMQQNETEEPTLDDLHRVGTVAVIRQMAKSPGGMRVLVEGIVRARAEFLRNERGVLTALLKPLPEASERTIEIEAHVRRLQELVDRALSLATGLSPDLKTLVATLDDPLRIAYLLASLLDMRPEDKQKLLEEDSLTVKLDAVAMALSREIEVLELKGQIQSKAEKEMTDAQREYMLRQQLKAIQSELGEGESEAAEIRNRVDRSAAAGNGGRGGLARGRPPGAHDPGVARVSDDPHLPRLGAGHPVGQDDRGSAGSGRGTPRPRRGPLRSRQGQGAHRRIPGGAEAAAVAGRAGAHGDAVGAAAGRALHGDIRGRRRRGESDEPTPRVARMRGPILCFVGPPGVGKTSLGQSIARAMNRKFLRMSLGGVRDEAEIRGHRRTYIGSMPGRLVQGLKSAGSANPVLMLDEIDKITVGIQGDPAAALLEVLDPAQNHAFRDHYMEIPIDLSRVLFIATANQLGTIHPALLDRMELISLSGYTEEEKVHIARLYLVPRQLEENGLTPSQLHITDDGLRRVITEYTREAGVRTLERQIGTIARKVAARVASEPNHTATVDVREVETYLGPPRFRSETAFRTSRPGVATGVAWTEAGGDVLFIEASLMPGTGQLTLTGQLGSVMQESARAALSHIRQQASTLGIPSDFLSKQDLHIHVPAGAIPKDGPSAGVTIATAIVSAARAIPVEADVAMTGEITLSGLVLPVGGIREKALAATAARHPHVHPSGDESSRHRRTASRGP